jgi:tetratricopeptide (TPR) repeat protein
MSTGMAARPGATPPVPQTPRTEVLKELQSLLESREARDRLDKGPLAEAKGREHWVLHLILKAFEAEQAHVNQLVGSAYSNLLNRIQAIEQQLGRFQEAQAKLETALHSQLESAEVSLAQRLQTGVDTSAQHLTETLNAVLTENLDAKWKPVGVSVDNFAQGSKQILKDVADTYRVATQTRLLLNENARRITDVGRDIIALEESLKLVVAKTLEEALQPFEQRLGAIESHLGVSPASAAASKSGNGVPPETQA